MTIGTLIAVVASLIVGATLLWAGIVKAISPHIFRVHLRNLGALPPKLVNTGVVAAAALEVAWGSALILRVLPAIVLPATALLLIIFTVVSWWGVHTGRTTDCGCYGGYVVPSLAQSILWNATLIAMVIGAWALGSATATPLWKIVTVIVAALATGSFTAAAQSFERKNGRFMIDMNPLKVGREWRSRWGASVSPKGEHLVSYLGPHCPHCKQWVRVLNAINPAAGLPDVVGVIASNEELKNFVESSGIRFPMRTIPQTLMTRLAWGVPTTVLVADGKIQNLWSGSMPPEFFQRFKEAFFPSAAGTPTVEAVASRNT